MSKKTLRKSEIKGLNKKITDFGVKLTKKDNVAVDDNIIYVNDKKSFFIDNNKVVPMINILLEDKNILKMVTVDMGAVKFIISGADIMRPGIVSFEKGIIKDEYVVIVDENNKKPFSVGLAMFDETEMKEMNFGKVIKNLHYVGDKLWKK